ncbi:hypothetical protein SLEP1_g13504 [Rubroshorea leprosula]|uniref:Pentatricopeptide repeat-containing protein n=1 Tax=Rubroshorea leprosula TaxID=152421 RepID=A0AAV5IG62_9ROSI|nr:hypothetical protein SLEP1_g13504 [Rubroshorea leprosula]
MSSIGRLLLRTLCTESRHPATSVSTKDHSSRERDIKSLLKKLSSLCQNGQDTSNSDYYGHMDRRNDSVRRMNSADDHRTDKFDPELEKMGLYSVAGFLKACPNSTSFSEGNRVFKELQEKLSFEQDKVIFKLLVPLVCEKGDVDFAFEMCQKILSSKCICLDSNSML